MWQRIQTLYLSVSFILTGLMFFMDKAVNAAGEAVKFTSSWPHAVLLAIIEILVFLALATPRHRIFQMRTAMMAALITLAFQIWLAVDLLPAHGLKYGIATVFPLVCVILDLLAARGIFADQMLVESASRLRKPRRK